MRLRHEALQLLRSTQGLAQPVGAAVPPQCAAEIDMVLRALDDPHVTPAAFARLVIKQIAEMKYPAEHMVTVRSELQVFERQLRVHGNDDAAKVKHETALLFRRAQDLTRAILPLSVDEVVNRLFSELQEGCNWGTNAIDLLRQELKPDDLQIQGCDAEGITTATRRIDREQLIIKYRPLAMTPEYFESWRQSHMRNALFNRSMLNEA